MLNIHYQLKWLQKKEEVIKFLEELGQKLKKAKEELEEIKEIAGKRWDY